MATAKPHHPARPPQRKGPRAHRRRNAFVAVVLLAALALAGFWHRLQTQAIIATSYGARIGCTCHYVAGRSLQDCRKDFEPGMALVTLSDHPETRAITARVPSIAEQTAIFHEGAGCQLQPWTP